MDANFTFPARPKPIPRPAPASPPEPVNRESNALRASVLDAALELGFGANGAVANWMFNNTLEEEDEDPEEDPIGRGPLSATSDEYAPYSTPPTSISSHSESYHPAPSPFSSPSPNTATPPQVHFPSMSTPVPAAPAHGNKLRKQRRDGGYESDGGYVSDGGKKARARTKSKPKDPAPPSPPPISEPMELIPLTKEERKKKKKEKSGKGSKDHGGAETDTEDVPKASKSKSSSKKSSKKPSTDAGTGYETDDGYVSSSGKPKTKGRSRFFSLRRKGESTSEAAVEPVPPMPEPPREVFQLPIASRFATTLPPGEGSATPSTTSPSRAETPLLPPSRPFAFASGSGASSPSSSSTNSLLTPADQDTFGNGSLSINTRGSGASAHSFADEESSLRSATETKSANRTVTFASGHISIPPPQEAFSSRSPSPQPPSPPNTNTHTNPSSKSKFFNLLTRSESHQNAPDSKANISYPITRVEPNANADAAKAAKHVPSPISLSPNTAGGNASGASRAASPMGSPYVLLTPINTSPQRAPSPAPSGYTDFEGGGDYIVPSRSGSPLPPPSPNVLAYYDVPPPSPPPNGPLPRAPRGAQPSAARDPTPGVARLRNLSQDRAGGGGNMGRLDVSSPSMERGARLDVASPLSGRASPVSPGGGGGMMSPMTPGSGGGVQRGRAAPFPSQPLNGVRTMAGMGPGLAARAKIDRYRDLYAIQIPPTPRGARHGGYTGDEGEYEDEYNDDDQVDIRVEEYYDGEADADAEEDREILGVLGRFQDNNDSRERAARRGSALERNNSGALRPGAINNRRAPSPSRSIGMDGGGAGGYSDDDEASRYPDEDKTAGRSTMYRVENGNGRDTMRWSDDYSTRASFMDVDKSEQARGQLVQRVGVMFDLSGRERNAVPPVPKLPAALLAAGPGGNRF
ncbi:hypothetical protein C8F04DRAFT_295375 [Mycena alexandri]|uniref:Uncharacterized protein n=1 Tax=Mycena alexandri TaxID=1745969 RepID=A0AAD6T5H8_9AGAR|nr:hypothetical protein C8F04DRAFT_295375 [Mycena alexandri]